MSEIVLPTQKHGRIKVAINFNKQIYNFKGYKTTGQYIYQSPAYTIFSYYEPLTDNFYSAEGIVVYTSGGRSILLEDYAKEWIIAPERTIEIFNSNDFLEQTCITHSLWRIRDGNDSLEPYNERLKNRAEEDGIIVKSLLRILEPEIRATAQRFFGQFRGIIEESEIYGQAYSFCSYIIAGENQKIVQDIIAFSAKNNRQESRRHNRGLRLHPLTTHKNSKNFDINKATEQAAEEIVSTFANVSMSLQHTLVEMLKPAEFANFASMLINKYSNRVYKPWHELNLRNYIFGGRYSLLFKLLRDYFKTEIKNRKKYISFDENTKLDGVSGFARRRWKVNSPNYLFEEKRKFLESVKGVLSAKQFEGYLKWLSGNYNSLDQNERQNLKRAKDKIISAKLNVPIPKSRH